MKKTLYVICLFLAAAIWGFAFSAQKAAGEIPPLTLGALRSATAFVFLLLIIPISSKLSHTPPNIEGKRRPLFSRHELIGGAICGTSLAVASFFQQAGIAAGADAGKSAFLTALYVVLVPIYSLVLGKRARLNVWVGAALAVIGLYLISVGESLVISRADLIVLICAFIFPIQILAIDRFLPGVDGVRLSAVQFGTAAILNALGALIFESGQDASLIVGGILPILYLGIASSGIAYTLQIIGQRGTSPTAAAIILSLESVFGAVGGALFFGESMSAREYIGCALMLSATVISQMDFKELKVRFSK